MINWSYSNERVGLDVRFGVSYASNPHQVREVALAAIATVERVLGEPAPVCNLAKFGDSSLDFALWFWIGDPIKGVGNVRSAVLFALWDAFKREGIEIPYPVHDMRLDKPVSVVLERRARGNEQPDQSFT